ncbi:MAG: hypothetical protein JWQ32_2940 [Marmoricola sp.]|nr:hypothetical protein [Marmoricola sp.]
MGGWHDSTKVGLPPRLLSRGRAMRSRIGRGHIGCVSIALVAASGCAMSTATPARVAPTGQAADQRLGLLARSDFTDAMPGAFLTTSGPIGLADARRAFTGCNNRLRGLLSAARLDARFSSEEVTNNDPETFSISSVLDARWVTDRPYDMSDSLKACGVRFTRVVRADATWLVFRAGGCRVWATSQVKDETVRLLAVGSSSNRTDPQSETVSALWRAWLS